MLKCNVKFSQIKIFYYPLHPQRGLHIYWLPSYFSFLSDSLVSIQVHSFTTQVHVKEFLPVPGWRMTASEQKDENKSWQMKTTGEEWGVEMISEWRGRRMIGGAEKRNRWSLEGGMGGGAGGSDCLRAAPLISVSLLVNIVCGLSHWMLRWMIDMAITCLLRWLKAVVLSAILNESRKSTSFCNNI